VTYSVSVQKSQTRRSRKTALREGNGTVGDAHHSFAGDARVAPRLFSTGLCGTPKWLSEQTFADLVALCKFSPGTTSSQVCYSIGMTRGGIPDAISARERVDSVGSHHFC
jgi:hypothetical protein